MLLSTALASGQEVDPTSDPNVSPCPGTPVSGYMLAWSDEFNGVVVDTNKWNFGPAPVLERAAATEQQRVQWTLSPAREEGDGRHE